MSMQDLDVSSKDTVLKFMRVSPKQIKYIKTFTINGTEEEITIIIQRGKKGTGIIKLAENFRQDLAPNSLLSSTRCPCCQK